MSKKYFSLIYSGEIQSNPEEKVIPSEEFSELLKASSVLEKAKNDAEEYLEHNKKTCSDILKESEEAGFNKGLTEFNKQILYFDEKIKQFEHELQKIVLPLALKAAKKIVGRELEIKPETIVDIVKQTLSPVNQSEHIKIYVNKKDKELLESQKKEIKKIVDHVKTLIIEEKDDVMPGGCVIVTDAGIINASLENQWDALESAFDTFTKAKR